MVLSNIFKKGYSRPLFLFGLFKQTIQFLQQINVKNDMSILYMMPSFEPTTSWTLVVSHNHKTRAPAQVWTIIIVQFLNQSYVLC